MFDAATTALKIPRRGGVPTWRHLGGALAWIAVVLVYAFTANSHFASVGYQVGLTALLGLGMVLVIGYAGQFSLAVGAFYGVGGYAAMIFTVKFGWYGLLALVIGAIAAGAIGMLVARPVFRLRGHFLAMATLALTQVFYLLFNNLEWTGGASGVGGIPALNLFGLQVTTPMGQVIVNWIIVGIVLWGALMLRQGREGRALLAIRGHEAASAAAGIDIAWSKTRIFTIAAVISAVAGSVYAFETKYVAPTDFDLSATIDILMIAVLGGMRSPWGAVIGAIVLEALKEVTGLFLPVIFGIAGAGAARQLILGVILVVILVVRPDGVAGALGQLIFWVVRKIRGENGPPDLAVEETGAETSDMAALRAEEDAADTPVIGDAVLRATGLVKRFGGVTAVNDVDLEIRSGEVLAVIGPNGAGKSTLVNLLSGNLVPTAGRIEISGVETTRLKAHEVARLGLARTFQTPALFEGMDVVSTVKVGAHTRGNVGMLRAAVPTIGALREEGRIDDIARSVLNRLGLWTYVFRDAKNLSLGQQKRVEIARALVASPKVILLDEPCAGLNKAEKATLMRLLRQLGREGIAVLVIEHDMEFVMSVADRVQVIDFGATLRVGTPAEVQADQAVIDAYLGVSHEPPEVTGSVATTGAAK
ncbi:branched-chain amino acid ABC transporter ATP-binding protein/permease [Gryllotalpicola sp.]|uniref:branched-chain amino acid ABC transporter ATP-binding protein/permease n=1 Tax=Gryllotalpicola sp. TaxID=1932787 RepID=UPI002624FCE8|nr:branched-chain amino acid ABC transporter ATP-binding protein/permease [Gryllotalpicola sp.]